MNSGPRLLCKTIETTIDEHTNSNYCQLVHLIDGKRLDEYSYTYRLCIAKWPRNNMYIRAPPKASRANFRIYFRLSRHSRTISNNILIRQKYWKENCSSEKWSLDKRVMLLYFNNKNSNCL